MTTEAVPVRRNYRTDRESLMHAVDSPIQHALGEHISRTDAAHNDNREQGRVHGQVPYCLANRESG